MSVFVKHSQPFTAVPNHLVNNDNISANALAAITYLAGKPTGWIARSYDIKKRFRWGDHTWRSVSKELRGLGVLRDMPHADGKQLIFELSWEEKHKAEGVDKPVDESCEPPVDFQQVGKPTVGNRRVYKERYTKKDLLIKKTSLERQISGDNPGGLPTEILPITNKFFKKIRTPIEPMTSNQEQERRKVLNQQLEQLANKTKAMP